MALKSAKRVLLIPMQGFVQAAELYVAAAMVLQLVGQVQFWSDMYQAHSGPLHRQKEQAQQTPAYVCSGQLDICRLNPQPRLMKTI